MNDTVEPEKKDPICENLYNSIFFCSRKTNIGQHLQRHCQMQPPILMADYIMIFIIMNL